MQKQKINREESAYVSTEFTTESWDSYRSVMKQMIAVPDNTPSSSIYLVLGILLAEAQRDLDILGLLGHIAVCPLDLKNVKDIISNNLVSMATW